MIKAKKRMKGEEEEEKESGTKEKVAFIRTTLDDKRVNQIKQIKKFTYSEKNINKSLNVIPQMTAHLTDIHDQHTRRLIHKCLNEIRRNSEAPTRGLTFA